MKGKLYSQIMAKFEMTQGAAGEFLGFSRRQSRRLTAGDASIPDAVAKLLLVMVAQKLTPADVDAICEKPPALL